MKDTTGNRLTPRTGGLECGLNGLTGEGHSLTERGDQKCREVSCFSAAWQMRRRRECRPRRLSRRKGLSAQHRRAETDERGRGRRREVTQGPAATGPGGGTGRGVLSLTPLQPRGCALFTPRPSTPRAAPGFPGLPSPPHPPAQPLLLLQGLVHKTVPQVKSLSLGCAPSCALRAAGPYQSTAVFHLCLWVPP